MQHNLLNKEISHSQSTHFVSWNESITDTFDVEGLTHLRDDHPDNIIEALAPTGAMALFCAITELIGHGGLKKAALLARGYHTVDPGLEYLLRDKFGEARTSALLNENILGLPKAMGLIGVER